MKLVVILVAILTCGAWAWAQKPKQAQPEPKPPAPAATPQTETVGAAQPAQAAPGGDGYLAPAQVKELLHKVWLAEYRINDLLTEVHPERWKLSEAARSSFQQTFETLRAQLAVLDGWRTQLDARPESMYLGYMTYATMDAVLPRLDGVARSIAQHENASLGAQFSQAGNQLFDLQQTFGLYLGTLLRNQDQVLQAMQNNLGACQNELGYALRGRAVTAKPVKNVITEYKGRRQSPRAPGGAGRAAPTQKPATIAPTKPAPKKP
jgi:hypothetical protein